MELDPDAFNEFLGEIGQDVRWRRASLCPCRDPRTGAAKPGCKVCGARGIVWADPVDAWAGVTSMRVKREWAAFGMWESGDEILTIPSDSPLYACGEKDRIVMLDSTEPFQNVLVRGKRELLNFSVDSFDLVEWLNPDQTALITSTVMPTEQNGYVVWPDGSGPPAGTQYSVRGRKHQEYYMLNELPRDRHHFHGADLPRFCQFRRWSLFGQVKPPVAPNGG